MKSVRCSSGAVEVVDVPAPVREGVRVRVRSAGICGSDLHLIAGGMDLPQTLALIARVRADYPAVPIVIFVNMSPAFVPKALCPPAPPNAPAKPPPRPRWTNTNKIKNSAVRNSMIPNRYCIF